MDRATAAASAAATAAATEVQFECAPGEEEQQHLVVILASSEGLERRQHGAVEDASDR